MTYNSGNWEPNKDATVLGAASTEGGILEGKNDAKCLVSIWLELEQQCQYAK